MSQSRDPLLRGRKETPLQRSDRNLIELLQEVRVVQTGVQVLFAFLLTAPLSARFPQLTSSQRAEYFVTLLASGAAAMLLMAPSAHHRILFRCGDKDHLVRVAHRYTVAGMACVGVAMLGALLFVSELLFGGIVAVVTVAGSTGLLTWCWVAAPLARRRRLRRTTEGRQDGVVPLRGGRSPGDALG